jgi:hypothetical protein
VRERERERDKERERGRGERERQEIARAQEKNVWGAVLLGRFSNAGEI